MKLPGVAGSDGVDGPVALGSVVGEGMVEDVGAEGFGNGEGSVGGAGVDDVDVVGKGGNARESRGERGFGVEGEEDDGGLQEAFRDRLAGAFEFAQR